VYLLSCIDIKKRLQKGEHMGKKDIKFNLDVSRSEIQGSKDKDSNKSKKIIYGFLIKKAFEMMDKK
jgi:hypothetical protein